MSIRTLALIAAGATSLILAGCGTVAPATSSEPDAAANPSISAPERSPRQAATPTPDRRPRIDQLILTTNMEGGVPVDDRSAIPTNAQVAYLAVRVRDVEPGTRFAAEWVRDGEAIGMSEHRSQGEAFGEQWIPLRFAPQGGFRFGRYAVRLSVEGQFIESLVFNAGGGSRTQAVTSPRLLFTTEWTGDQATTRARTSFRPGTEQVVAILTDAGDASPENLTSYWRLNDEEVAQVPANSRSGTEAVTFTLQAGSGLAPGSYDVVVRAGNQRVTDGSFFIQSGTEATHDPVVQEFVVTTEIDTETSLPLGEPLDEVATPAEVYGMVLVENLRSSDMLEVVWYREGEEASRSQLTDQSLTRNWIRYRYNLPAEEAGSDASYRAVVLLNDSVVKEHHFVALRQQ